MEIEPIKDDLNLNKIDRQHRIGKIAGGILIVIIGSLFLAKELGVIIPVWLFSWKVLLIALGLVHGIKSGFKRPWWLVLVFYGIDLILIFAYYQPSKSNRYYRFIFILVFTILNSITVRFLVDWMHIDVIGYSEFLFLSMPIRSAFTLLLLSFVTVMSWLMNELENQRQQEKRRVDTEQMIKEAELGLLRQKLQPHFLFNSLNSISALAISQPDEARNMIHQLSDFLRGTMKKDDQEFVKFDEEIKHLQLYLEIEKVRFGHRLIVDMNIASEALSKMVPPLIMQPIVENAIKFGLYGTLEETMIKIEANLEGSYLVIKTENPFDADSQGNSSGTGFGLTSIQRRLFFIVCSSRSIENR